MKLHDLHTQGTPGAKRSGTQYILDDWDAVRSPSCPSCPLYPATPPSTSDLSLSSTTYNHHPLDHCHENKPQDGSIRSGPAAGDGLRAGPSRAGREEDGRT